MCAGDFLLRDLRMYLGWYKLVGGLLISGRVRPVSDSLSASALPLMRCLSRVSWVVIYKVYSIGGFVVFRDSSTDTSYAWYSSGGLRQWSWGGL